MSRYKVTIASIDPVTHDVMRIRTEKPAELDFTPGQATEIFLDRPEWADEGRPFTFTSLPDDDYLEFTIKCYEERKGVTNEIRKLRAGDHLVLNDVFGAIAYKGEGVFIAGGAGVTPFISILRSLHRERSLDGNKLIFGNKTTADIILKDEFERLLGSNFVNILSEENAPGHAHGFITADFLRSHISDLNKHMYVCGPPPMIDAVERHLAGLNVDPRLIVKEEV